jgi:uncharacterized phage protein gp47/JayE
MQLQLQSFTTLVQNMAAGVQSSARVLLDLTTGSVLRAILEANASVALWLQWVAVQVLSSTRAATSSGADLDSWVGDFGLARLPGQAASTTLTFSRFTPGAVANIPVGAQVKTGDTTVTFSVLADPTNAAYSVALASYIVPAVASSLSVAAQAMAPGVFGNVAVGAISLLATAMPGIDTVTNTNAAAGGIDAEPDATLRLRFSNFIDSRSRATPAAIAFAIQSLQQGLGYVLSENADPSGDTRPGFFTVTVDDGSGYPPSTTLAAVSAALEAVRPIGTQFAVQPPTVFTANIAMTVTTPLATHPAAQASVAAAVQAYAATLPIGTALPLSRIAAIAYGADPSITNVSQLSINGAGDLRPSASGIIKLGTVTVD